jgi:hypothetical protein
MYASTHITWAERIARGTRIFQKGRSYWRNSQPPSNRNDLMNNQGNKQRAPVEAIVSQRSRLLSLLGVSRDILNLYMGSFPPTLSVFLLLSRHIILFLQNVHIDAHTNT